MHLTKCFTPIIPLISYLVEILHIFIMYMIKLGIINHITHQLERDSRFEHSWITVCNVQTYSLSHCWTVPLNGTEASRDMPTL